LQLHLRDRAMNVAITVTAAAVEALDNGKSVVIQ
jgi:hypothetical protein